MADDRSGYIADSVKQPARHNPRHGVRFIGSAQHPGYWAPPAGGSDYDGTTNGWKGYGDARVFEPAHSDARRAGAMDYIGGPGGYRQPMHVIQASGPSSEYGRVHQPRTPW